MLARESFDSPPVWRNRRTLSQAAQKGRPARPQPMKAPEAYQFSPTRPELPRQLFLRTGYVEDAFEARTMHGKRRVSACRGWAGEKGDFFSSLLLGAFAALQIPQSDLECFSRNFCPADLRIFGEDCSCFGILNFQVQNLNDPVINLDICHGHPPLGETVRWATIGRRLRRSR